MLDLNALCQTVYDNKVKKHSNVSDVPLELCHLFIGGNGRAMGCI